MSFKLYRETQLEKLAERFVEDVYRQNPAADQPLQLLQPHLVVVQTRGMAEYLRQYVAMSCTAAANLSMPFLESFVNSIFRRIYGESFRKAERRSDLKNMRNFLMKRLSDPACIAPESVVLQKYIAEDNSGLKRWQLAGKIADLFDQYQHYRVVELAENKLFASGCHDWQRELYSQLFNADNPGRDYYFYHLLKNGLTAQEAACLPEEISVFGVGALPQIYLDFFVRIAEYCRVNFFYLSPCLEYWEHQLSRREKRLQAWDVDDSAGGNPILQALGRQGRGFFSALMSHEHIQPQWEAQWHEPDDNPGTTMLEIMQHDIHYLFDRRLISDSSVPGAEFIGKPHPELRQDCSIAIHNCHSIRRQLEVLHDELLKLINGKGILPQNIIVMAPDIISCAPIIHAVFGSGALRKVYSIADLPLAGSTSVSEAFHRIFSAAAGRFEYSEVMALMDLPLISARLELEDGDLSEISQLLYDGGVRWGFDGNMRDKFCRSKFDEFSWRMVFDRLLAGFACRSAGGVPPLLGNVKSLEAVESGEIGLLARLICFMEGLADLSEKISSQHTILQWHDIFSSVISDFFPDDNSYRTALAPLRSALHELQILGQEKFAPGTYDLSAALAMLDDNWESSGENGRFLRGKITFCRMMPMRSIPADAVAILNLNEGDFPRRDERLGFDLLSLHTLPGDRSQAAQDRYLLLEALLAARKYLLLFYQGRNACNNQEQPPCAPLSEIAAYLHNAFDLQEYKHKVSGIDEVYYCADSACRSLNMDNFRALQELRTAAVYGPAEQMEQIRPDKFEPFDPGSQIAIDELVSYLSNPMKWTMRNQFGLSLQKTDENDNSGNDEPWNLARMDNWKVDSLISDLQHCSDDVIYQHALRSNLLPPGPVGVKEFAARSGVVRKLPANWGDLLTALERRPVVCHLEAEHCRISGMVNLTADGSKVVNFCCSSCKGKHALTALLGTWAAAAAFDQAVSAVVLNISHGEYEMRCTPPIDPAAARTKLAMLLQRIRSCSQPPLLLPTASLYYRDMAIAADKFYNRKGDYGDVTDPAIRQFYTPDSWEEPDFQQEFTLWAEMVYGELVLQEAAQDD